MIIYSKYSLRQEAGFIKQRTEKKVRYSFSVSEEGKPAPYVTENAEKSHKNGQYR